MEAAPAQNGVLYYDYQSEYSVDFDAFAGASGPIAGDYIRAVYDGAGVPRGKRGNSILAVGPDAPDLAQELQGRRLDYADFHMNNGEVGINPNMATAIQGMQASFPNSTIVLGEYGRGTGAAGTCTTIPNNSCPNTSPTEEASQQSWILGTLAEAQTRAVPFTAIWFHSDFAPNWQSREGVVGEPGDPKHALGGLSVANGIAANGDMETVSSGIPVAWAPFGIGGADGVLTASSAAPASNSWFARMTSVVAGDMGVKSSAFAVSPAKDLYVNFYVRSDMANVRLEVFQLPQSGEGTLTVGPSILSPSASTWQSYLGTVGSWRVSLSPSTANVVLRIRGTSSGPSQVLDVDTVSTWQQ